MKYVFFLFLTAFGLQALAQTDTTQQIVSGRTNSAAQQKKPYVILISMDGFRYDYAPLHGAKNLLALAEKGVRARYMEPSFPSLTFPNHYTLVTGLYPSHHGLVGNSFYDRKRQALYTMRSHDKVTDGYYYGGTPLWVLSEKQQMLSASFYWVGSEAAIQGVRPTYYYHYNESIGIESRIQTVVNWLSLPPEKRPHLITFYFPEVDHAGHDFGPNSVEVRNAVRWVDSALVKLTTAVDALQLDVNYIVVSDHGMTQIDTRHPIPLKIDTSRFSAGFSAEIVHLYAREPQFVQPYYEQLKAGAHNYRVFLKSELPQAWHYGEKDDRLDRIGDLVLVPEWPQVFSISGRTPKPGSHGYDPHHLPDMRAIFYAWGPAFRQQTIGVVKNVDVFTVVANLLGLNYQHQIDGTEGLSRKILKAPSGATKTKR